MFKILPQVPNSQLKELGDTHSFREGMCPPYPPLCEHHKIAKIISMKHETTESTAEIIDTDISENPDPPVP